MTLLISLAAVSGMIMASIGLKTSLDALEMPTFSSLPRPSDHDDRRVDRGSGEWTICDAAGRVTLFPEQFCRYAVSSEHT